MKREPDERREQKDYIHRIRESLPVLGIARPRWVEGAPVVSLLNFESDFVAVGIALMQQQFASAQPARVKVGEITARLVVRSRVGHLMPPENPVHIKPQ